MIFPELHALGDGILMGTGKGSEHQLPCIGLPFMDMHPRHPFIHFDDFRHIREIDARIDTHGIHVHADGNDIDIARPFAVAKERPFDAVGAGQQSHFGIGNARSPVVVRVQRQNDVIAVLQIPGHVGDLGGVHMRHGHLHRRRQIDDGLTAGGRLPYVEDGIADIEGKFRFRPGEAFR